MYKVVLIDSKQYILNSLKGAVAWENYDMEVTAVFTSTLQAYDYIKAHHVDLIITEELMPDMAGTELIENAKLFNSNTMFVVLTDCESFECATNALRLGALDYVLKPIDNNVLCNLIEKAQKKLDTVKTSDNTVYDFFENIDSTLSFANSEISHEKFVELLRKDGHNIKSSNPCASILKFKINNLPNYLGSVWMHSLDRLYPAILHLMTVAAGNRIVFMPLYLRFSSLTTVAIMKDDDFCSPQDINKLCEDITKNIMECLKADIYFADIKFFSSLDKLQKIAPFYINSTTRNRNLNSNPVDQAKEYIQNNYMNDISLAEIAKAVCLSQYHFSRLFIKETGQNFTNYLNNTRLEIACDLIINTDNTINDIYSAVGFNSKNHFYKLFKNRFGVPPMDYKKKYAKS